MEEWKPSESTVRAAVKVIKAHLRAEWISHGCEAVHAFGCASCQAHMLEMQLDSLANCFTEDQSLPSHPISETKWQTIETAPKDGTRVLLRTHDFGAVEGWWEQSVTNFYKSQEGWASYDPDNMQGDWVSEWGQDQKDRRLYCGAAPTHWTTLPDLTSP